MAGDLRMVTEGKRFDSDGDQLPSVVPHSGYAANYRFSRWVTSAAANSVITAMRNTARDELHSLSRVCRRELQKPLTFAKYL